MSIDSVSMLVLQCVIRDVNVSGKTRMSVVSDLYFSSSSNDCIMLLYLYLLTFLLACSEMENAGIIQVDCELDLFILHQVATNLFQRTLETYVDSWNNHPIRTEGRKTPNQLYISGLVLLKQRQDAGEFIRPRVELLHVYN